MITLPSTLDPSPADALFHNWCNSAGIPISPSVQLVTTPQSVAGRGVFSLDPLQDGDIIAVIPSYCVFRAENAAECFPDVAEDIRRNRKRATSGAGGGWIGSLWQKLLRRDNEQRAALSEGGSWQAELTRYALAAVERDHPWATWISQWHRDDPMHGLFKSGAAQDDAEAISDAAAELKAMMPELSRVKIQAALSLRLARFEEHKGLGLDDSPSTAAMYSTLCSRAIDLDGGCTGVIPFYDMFNHNLLSPNVALDFDGERFALFANQDINEGEELFLCYTNLDEAMDENSALWALVQWGIPTPRIDFTIAEESSD